MLAEEFDGSAAERSGPDVDDQDQRLGDAKFENDSPLAELVALLDAQTEPWPDESGWYDSVHIDSQRARQWLVTNPKVADRVNAQIRRLANYFGFEVINSFTEEFEVSEEEWSDHSSRTPRISRRCEGCDRLRLLVVSSTHSETGEELAVTIASSVNDYIEIRAQYGAPSPHHPDEEEAVFKEMQSWERRTARMRDRLVEELKSTAQLVRDDLRDAAPHLSSVLPTLHPTRSVGFSTGTPKASHIRASFWQRLQTSQEFVLELDWTAYRCRQRGIEPTGEVALAGFRRVVDDTFQQRRPRHPESPRFLLEFERIWLSGDVEDVSSCISRVASSFQGLRRVLNALRMARSGPLVAGVIVATFADGPKELQNVTKDLLITPEMARARISTLWEDETPVFLTPSGLAGWVHMRETYLRLDLVEVLPDPPDLPSD